MGLVVFSGFAELAVPPTTDREELIETIDSVTTGRGTAIGAAMLKGLDAIAEVNPAVQPVGDVSRSTTPRAERRQRAAPRSDDYVPDIIVLLTDGRNTRGIEPLDAVPHAVERRVRVYTIGFGTTEPVGARVHARAARRPGLRGRRRRGSAAAFGGFGGGFLVADAPTLMAVAEQTGGEFHARRGRRPAARGLRRAPEGGRHAEAAHRDHVDARGARRAPRGRGRRSLDPLEPVPLARRGVSSDNEGSAPGG